MKLLITLAGAAVAGLLAPNALAAAAGALCVWLVAEWVGLVLR